MYIYIYIYIYMQQEASYLSSKPPKSARRHATLKGPTVFPTAAAVAKLEAPGMRQKIVARVEARALAREEVTPVTCFTSTTKRVNKKWDRRSSRASKHTHWREEVTAATYFTSTKVKKNEGGTDDRRALALAREEVHPLYLLD